ncbi:CTP synthetase [Histidinibacterium lentulum]|uniref:CTP synthetase n=1 Tax=Histidinibacterium lentulum TaxID=2480588 RepID=A0A3N2R826_9RHOB|nr:CTP synthetase [Histidinibacterium lentulum]ROU03587.1 CTP synthetase [Histidinibacterium lentulum]
MIRLAVTLHSLIGTTLAGSLVTAVLVAGYGTLAPILAAAALGFLAAIPASLLVAKRILG